MTEQSHDDRILESLQSLGEQEVRSRFMKGQYGAPGARNHSFVSVWLDGLASARAEKSTGEQLALSRSADSSAKEALRIARRANTIAIIAAIAAVAAAIAAIIALFLGK